MTKYKIATSTEVIEFGTLDLANAWNTANGTSFTVTEFSDPVPGVDMAGYIDAKIKGYQDKAPALLRELYVSNTLAGISAVQSDQMFDDYADILTRIREGAFPTALHRLQYKRPSGFVTQVLIDAWRDKILSYL